MKVPIGYLGKVDSIGAIPKDTVSGTFSADVERADDSLYGNASISQYIILIPLKGIMIGSVDEPYPQYTYRCEIHDRKTGLHTGSAIVKVSSDSLIYYSYSLDGRMMFRASTCSHP